VAQRLRFLEYGHLHPLDPVLVLKVGLTSFVLGCSVIPVRERRRLACVLVDAVEREASQVVKFRSPQ
jgi:hypothetical protein